LNSVKIKSISPDKVIAELKRWAKNIVIIRPEIKRIGYFWSYARGDYTPASDLDIILIISKSNKIFPKRIDDYIVDNISVGCEVFPFTEAEIEKRKGKYKNGWIDTIIKEAVWIL